MFLTQMSGFQFLNQLISRGIFPAVGNRSEPEPNITCYMNWKGGKANRSMKSRNKLYDTCKLYLNLLVKHKQKGM